MVKSKYDPYKNIICSGELTAKELTKIIGDGCTTTQVYAARQRFLRPAKYLDSTRKWRKNHRSAANKQNREYRSKHSKNCHNNRVRWAQWEDELVLSEKYLAKDLAEKLGRTIIAIYSRRVFLNRKKCE